MTAYLGDKAVGVNTVVEKEVAKTKFGASIDNFLGNVNEEGTLSEHTESINLNFSGVKTIASHALSHRFQDLRYTTINADFSTVEIIEANGLESVFQNCMFLNSFVMSALKEVGYSGMSEALNGALRVTELNLPSLESVGTYGLNKVCYSCTGLVRADLGAVKTVDNNGLEYAFSLCTALESIDLNSLQTLGANAMRSALQRTKIKTISFPSLISVQTNSFGSATIYGTFQYCDALTEIHFRADMQATIEAMSQYASKWGATNATIYFDL